MLFRGRVRVVGPALVVEVVDEAREPPALRILAEAHGVGAHRRLHGEHVLPQGIAGGVLVHERERVVAGGERGHGRAVGYGLRGLRRDCAGRQHYGCPDEPHPERIPRIGTKVLAGGPPFLREVRRSGREDDGAFPFTVPVIRALESLALRGPVTFFVGENGSGKSTLLEAIAAAAGLPAVGSADLDADATLGAQRRLGERASARLVAAGRRAASSCGRRISSASRSGCR